MESTALRHGKKIIAKLEERVRGLEDELGKLFNSSAFVWRSVVRGVPERMKTRRKRKSQLNQKDPSPSHYVVVCTKEVHCQSLQHYFVSFHKLLCTFLVGQNGSMEFAKQFCLLVEVVRSL